MFAVDPGGLSGTASAFPAIGDDIVGLGVAAAAALQSMSEAAGDGGLTGILGAASGSAAASLDEVAKHAHAFGPALTQTATNYDRSDTCSAHGLQAR